MKTILRQLETLGRYTLFAGLITGAFYSIIYVGTDVEPTPKAAAMLHKNMCEGADVTFDGCREVAGK